MTRTAVALIGFLTLAVPSFGAWTAVKDWNGTGSKTTETFAVASKEWRVNWSSKSDGDGLGSFGVLVFTEDKKLVASATARVGASDVTYVHEGPGRYYIEVTAADVSWTLNVEDDR